MRDRMRGLLVRARSSPLFMSQIVSSGYGAVSTIAGAWLLTGSGFTLFSLLLLVQQFSLLGFRSAVGSAALVNVRVADGGPVGARHAVIWWLVLSPLTLGVFFAFHIHPVDALVLLGLLLMSNLHDCLRFRGIHFGAYWVVFWSDFLRGALVGVVLLVLLVADRGLSAVELSIYLWALATVGVLVLAIWLPKSRVPLVRLRELRSVGSFQLAEFLITQTQTSLPLLVLGAVSGSSVIGAYRLAQTFMGPVNLVSAALGMNLLAQVTTEQRASDVQVISMADRLARQVAAIATASVLVGLAVVAVPGTFPAIGRLDLVIAMLAVGFAAVVAGFASPHLIALRVLLAQRFLLVCQIGTVASTWLGFAVGWVIAGPRGSLTAGFVVAALAIPLTILIPSRRVIYRRVHAHATGTPVTSAPSSRD